MKYVCLVVPAILRTTFGLHGSRYLIGSPSFCLLLHSDARAGVHPRAQQVSQTTHFVDYRTVFCLSFGVSFLLCFFQLAEVARTPWLDPYVAGGILAAKALSEGDWRIGKGALAGWADRALSSLSNTGAKVLRVGSGNEVRPTFNDRPRQFFVLFYLLYGSMQTILTHVMISFRRD